MAAASRIDYRRLFLFLFFFLFLFLFLFLLQGRAGGGAPYEPRRGRRRGRVQGSPRRAGAARSGPGTDAALQAWHAVARARGVPEAWTGAAAMTAPPRPERLARVACRRPGTSAAAAAGALPRRFPAAPISCRRAPKIGGRRGRGLGRQGAAGRHGRIAPLGAQKDPPRSPGGDRPADHGRRPPGSGGRARPQQHAAQSCRLFFLAAVCRPGASAAATAGC